LKELSDIYDQVEGEILERQKYLEDVLSAGLNVQIEDKIKKEIADRFNDLQKIRKMMNEI